MTQGYRELAWAPILALLAIMPLHALPVASRRASSRWQPRAGPWRNLPANARILAPDKYGGYLIYHFAGARKVFFDGRSDYYGSNYMKNYLT